MQIQCYLNFLCFIRTSEERHTSTETKIAQMLIIQTQAWLNVMFYEVFGQDLQSTSQQDIGKKVFKNPGTLHCEWAVSFI